MYGDELFDCIEFIYGNNSAIFDTDRRYAIAWTAHSWYYIQEGDVVNSDDKLHRAF